MDLQMLPEILIRATSFQEAKFFIIIHISYLPEVNIQVKNGHGVLDRLVPCIYDKKLEIAILDLPIYLLYVTKIDDEKRCFFK